MKVKSDGTQLPKNGASSICPNLRYKKTGFLKSETYCSCNNAVLNWQYVNSVCKNRVYDPADQTLDLKYMDCNQYKMNGIRN